MKQILAFALLSAFSNSAFAGCPVPKGEVDYLQTRIYATGPGMLVTRIEPSRDCKTAKVWTYSPESPLSRMPNDEDCTKAGTLGTGFGFGSLLGCTSFPIYPSMAEASDKPLPHAFLKDGAIVTRQRSYVSGFDLGTASNVFIQTGSNKVIGAFQLEQSSTLPPAFSGIAGSFGVGFGSAGTFRGMSGSPASAFGAAPVKPGMPTIREYQVPGVKQLPSVAPAAGGSSIPPNTTPQTNPGQ